MSIFLSGSICLFTAFLILLAAFGCATSEKTTVQVQFSMNAVDPDRTKEQQGTKEDGEIQKHLLRGQKFFIQGDYEESLREYQKVVSLSANDHPGDEGLFNMGLIYAHPRNPKRNLAMSFSVLQRLTKNYPQSPWAEKAKVWVELFQENETLKQVVEKSKQVDIEIEEKKRERAK